MATWPNRNQQTPQPWDLQLKNYIDVSALEQVDNPSSALAIRLRDMIASEMAAGNFATVAELTAGLASKAAINHVHTADDITDATVTGKALMRAASAAAARTAIGAGTSNLALGTTSTTAKAGDYQPTWAQVTGKPTTFAPSAHTHPTSEIVGLDGTLSGYGSRISALEAGGGGGGGAGINVNDVGYDIFLIIGQSNASGSGLPVLTTVYDTPHPRVKQYACSGTYNGTIMQGLDPTENVPADPSEGVGFAMQFGREWAKRTPSNREVLIIPAAVGGTALVGGPWAVGGAHYNTAVAAANAAVAAAGPNSRVVAMLWAQGEGDAVANRTQSQYAAALDAMITGLRTAITNASNSIFVVGSMVPEWRNAPNGSSLAIHAAHVDTPNRVANSLFVDGPSAMNQDTGGIHYSAAGARELGRRMCAAMFATPSAPLSVINLRAFPDSTQIFLTWQSVSAYPNVTDYVVQYKASASGTWLTFADGVSTLSSTVVTGLTNGTAYDFRVAAVNSIGTGPWSSVVASTPSTTSAYANAVNADNPLIYLPLNEVSKPFVDRKGLVTPTTAAAVTAGAAPVGDGPYSADLPGTTGAYLDLGSPAGFSGVSALTVEMLIRPDTTPSDFFLISRDSAASGDWRFAVTQSQVVEFYKFTDSTVRSFSATGQLTSGNTYHLAAVYNGSTIKVYKNGAEIASAAATGTLGATRPITIGATSSGTFPTDGKIGGVALYNTALTAARLLAHAQAAGVV